MKIIACHPAEIIPCTVNQREQLQTKCSNALVLVFKLHQCLQTSTSQSGFRTSIRLAQVSVLNKCLQSFPHLPGGKGRKTKPQIQSQGVQFWLKSAGKHGTLTSGFSNVTSGDRAVVGAKKLQFCTAFLLHGAACANRKASNLPALPLVGRFCKQ